eukprot:768059-Hanusia_phi.AAC.2
MKIINCLSDVARAHREMVDRLQPRCKTGTRSFYMSSLQCEREDNGKEACPSRLISHLFEKSKSTQIMTQRNKNEQTIATRQDESKE